MRQNLRYGLGGSFALLSLTLLAGCGSDDNENVRDGRIRHLIVVSGENRSFDNVFATYTPPDSTQAIWNLRSRGIIQGNGKPGPNAVLAQQQQASSTSTYELSPTLTRPFSNLPQPNITLYGLSFSLCVIGKLDATIGISDNPQDWNLAHISEFCEDAIGLKSSDYGLLSEGGTGQPFFNATLGLMPVPDCRYPSTLSNGPYSIVGASQLNDCSSDWLKNIPDAILKIIGEIEPIKPATYISHTGDPVHRFYQMWQQSNCSAAQSTADNPSGCKSNLYAWVATTVGWNIAPPQNDQGTFQGGVTMGYYDMDKGDWPYFKALADRYAINDNYHQPVMGGTGANSQFMMTGDVYYYTDQNGNPAQPPSNQIENPNPVTGTNNFYIRDQIGVADPGSTGVAYTDCSDHSQPGVKSIMDYLHALPYVPFNDGNCAHSRWYQVNNNYPYYNTAGQPISAADKNAFPAGPQYSIGPQVIPTIGDALSAKGAAIPGLCI